MDIAVLGKNLAPGTPVALAERVSFSDKPTPDDLALVNTLYKRTHDWAKAWSGRSKKFFDYYDADAYSLAQGESFKAFRAQKERVFKAVSFIDVKVNNLQALQGPGYWVTWFQQDYRASNLSTKGIRRLYWQKDRKGQWRIVGMEWAPHLSGTLTAGLNGAPVASESATAKTDKGADAPVAVAAIQPKPAPAPEKPAQAPVPATPSAAPAARPTAAPQTSAAAAPQSPAVVAASPADGPIEVALAEMAGKNVRQAGPDSGAQAKADSPKPDTPKANTRSPGDVTAFIESWRTAWEKGDLKGYAACYDANAVQGGRTGAAAIRSHKAGLWKKSRPKHVILTNIRITSKQDMIVADMHQAYTDSRSFADMGIKTLFLQAKGNSWRIVREDWSPMQQ